MGAAEGARRGAALGSAGWGSRLGSGGVGNAGVGDAGLGGTRFGHSRSVRAGSRAGLGGAGRRSGALRVLRGLRGHLVGARPGQHRDRVSGPVTDRLTGALVYPLGGRVHP